MKLRDLTLTELLLARQFLVYYTNSTSLKTVYARVAQSALAELDKEVWAMVISSDTPWGKVKPRGLKFEDEDFDQTLEDLTAGKFDEGETEK